MAAAFVVFALISAMLIPRYRPDFPARHMGWFIAACVVFTVGMLATVAFVAKETEHEASAETHVTETEPSEPPPAEPSSPTETGAAGSDAAGKVIFETNCASCHTLSDAGATGTIGPNLDEAQRPRRSSSSSSDERRRRHAALQRHADGAADRRRGGIRLSGRRHVALQATSDRRRDRHGGRG